MRVFFLVSFLCYSVFSFGQKSYTTKFIDQEAKIDGIANEPFWQDLPEATDFTIRYPNTGEASEAKTKVKLFYSTEAIYISAELHDTEPDKVSYTLSQRDNVGNGDWFGFTIDPWGNQTNAFSFRVTAAGVEVDILRGLGNNDVSWNAVWKSATMKTEYGWSLEMMIPFAAIRFPNKDVQNWNVNFERQVRRRREQSFWNPVDPAVFGEITQMGKLVGVKNIKSPLRLSFTPFLTGYIEKNGDDKWRPRVTGGMDVKYGINDAFTLDVSLIPDFGQTVSDNQVLNLSPFEVRFNENRPFFLEGTDLFRIGNLFYSRRIGGGAHNFGSAFSEYSNTDSAELVSANANAQLINATKISGRTKKGLGIGFFNAIERSQDLIFKDSNGLERSIQSHPFSNYNVFVLSQNLPNNSQVSFVNTIVMRAGHSRDANVTGVVGDVFSKDGKFNVDASLNVSSIFENGRTDLGHTLGIGVNKVGGTFQYGAFYEEESDTYDPNDLGFLYNNNSRSISGFMAWRSFEPKGKLLRRWIETEAYYEQLYKPNLYSILNVAVEVGATFENFLTTGLNANFSPIGEVNHFESRTWGREVRYNPSIQFGGFYSSDYSRRFALDMNGWFKEFLGNNQRGANLVVSPRFRFSDRFFMVWRTNLSYFMNDYGYVLGQDVEDQIVIGNRNRTIVENSLNAEFIFTKRMGMTVRFRHYWQQVKYTGFSELFEGGNLNAIEYGGYDENGYSDANNNYDAFTVDVNFRWIFIPGSELLLVYKNNIFNGMNGGFSSYFGTFEDLFDQPQLNSISLKVLVFVDSRYFKRKKKNRKLG